MSELKTKEGKRAMDKLHSEFGFTTPIPDCVIQAIPEIGPEGFTMFCYLMFRIYNDKRTRGEFIAWPSWKNMQIQTGLSNHKISKGLKALVKAGFLERKKRFSNSVIYKLKAPESQFSNNWRTEESQFSHSESDEENTGSSLTVREQFSNSENSSSERLTKTKKVNKPKKQKQEESIIITALLQKHNVSESDTKKSLIRAAQLHKLSRPSTF